MSEEELKLDEVIEVEVPNLIGLKTSTAKSDLSKLKLKYEVIGDGAMITKQLPVAGEKVKI